MQLSTRIATVLPLCAAGMYGLAQEVLLQPMFSALGVNNYRAVAKVVLSPHTQRESATENNYPWVDEKAVYEGIPTWLYLPAQSPALTWTHYGLGPGQTAQVYTQNGRAAIFWIVTNGISSPGPLMPSSLTIFGRRYDYLIDSRTEAQKAAAPRFASNLNISNGAAGEWLVTGTVENVNPSDATIEWWDGNAWRALGGMLRQTADDPDTRGFFAGYVPGTVNTVIVRVRSSASSTNYGWAGQRRKPYISYGSSGAPKLNGLQPSNRFRIRDAAIMGVRG